MAVSMKCWRRVLRSNFSVKQLYILTRATNCHCIQSVNGFTNSVNFNYVKQYSLKIHKLIGGQTQNPNLKIVCRTKYTRKQSDGEKDLDTDDEEKWENDPLDKDSRIVKQRVNSLRTDLILKAGLGIARNKVETLFYESKIRVNGCKIFKKSSQLRVGDEVDVIRGQSPMNPDFILVSRVEVLSAKENDDGMVNVQLRRYKSIAVENYADPWKGTMPD